MTFGWCEDSYTFFFSERSVSVFPSIRSLECRRTEVTVLYWGGGDVSKNTFPGGTRKEGMYVRHAQRSGGCSAHLWWLHVCICTLQFSREWETSGSCWLGCYWCCELFQNCWIWRTSQCFSGTGKSVSKHLLTATSFSHCIFLLWAWLNTVKWERKSHINGGIWVCYWVTMHGTVISE